MEFALAQAVERLPAWEPIRSEKVQSLNNLRAGMAGEKRIYETILSVKMHDEAAILQDMALPLMAGSTFQMDLVLVAKSGILLIESKQIAGRLRFHPVPAELRKVDEDGKIQAVYDCPVAQLSDQQQNLHQWLTMAGYQVPVYGAVVFANNPVIEEIGQNAPVYKMREVRNLIRRHLVRQPVMDTGEIRALEKSMRLDARPYLPFPLKGIHSAVGRLGPLCLYCSEPLQRHSQRNWLCAKCKRREKDPGLVTLLAWFLLVRKTIRPREVMILLELKSHESARGLLARLPLIKIGKGKAVEYMADYGQLAQSDDVIKVVKAWLAGKEAIGQ